MEETIKLFANYSQTGHQQYPEDTWDLEREISSVNDLFQFMKDIHRLDARHFNNYPLNGGCSKNGFSFFTIKSILVDGEEFNGNRVIVETPTYFDDAYKMYNAFYLRMKSTLPKLRKAYELKAKKYSEIQQLNYLKSKYENK
jgi:hypothetical protein